MGHFTRLAPLGWAFGNQDIHLLTSPAFSNWMGSGDLTSGHQIVKMGSDVLSRLWNESAVEYVLLRDVLTLPRNKALFLFSFLNEERRRIFNIWAKKKNPLDD